MNLIKLNTCVVLIMLLPLLQTTAQEYQIPSPALAKLVEQSKAPQVRVSQDHQWLATLNLASLPSIAELAQSEKRLAGLRINPNLLAPSRSRSIYESIELTNIASGKRIELDNLPEGQFSSVSFSPNSRYLSFINKNDVGLFLYIFDIKNNTLSQLLKHRINDAMGTAYQWMYDSSAIITKSELREDSRPAEKTTPKGPTIQQSQGQQAPVRTYQDLLTNSHDAAWFDYLTKVQLISVDLAGQVTMLGEPGNILSFQPSPDSSSLLVRQLLQPYSYLVPYYRFAQKFEVWDQQGRIIKQIASIDAAENLPKGFDSVRTGRRDIEWRADKAATLFWAEALDGGDMKKELSHHDQLYTWSKPFNKVPHKFLKTEQRYRSISWGEDNLALVSEWRFADRKIRVWKIDSENPQLKLLWQNRSRKDGYNDPGRTVKTRSKFGTSLIRVTDDQTILLQGNGASPEGNIPFLNSYSFKTLKTKQLWHSEAPFYERSRIVLDDDATKLLTIRESADTPPNYYLRDLTNNSITPLTHFEHPTPEFLNISKELIQYQREDGVDLSGTLYLPAEYSTNQGRIPVLMWAYPREYKDAKVAGQIRTSPYQFKRVSYWGPIPFLAQGIAVFSGPAMPIIGKGDALPNDSFRNQLVMNAEAAIKVLVDKGIADPDRIVIGGHSYGAFMVANLLAHSDLFTAGIARSGAYNRTLTPFGFQGEERDFWQASAVYATMSPFFHAEKINEPLLMIHGEADNNSGTYPIQSKRMYAAMKGLGGNARLVMLPNESHRYVARESLLHMLWEEQQWLKQWLVNDKDN
ncbi:MAG: S9 family peptidase [Gammaproteobacteria bacterium]|nr:S9 family peptidase [Gammaproteobacteria bacterium]